MTEVIRRIMAGVSAWSRSHLWCRRYWCFQLLHMAWSFRHSSSQHACILLRLAPHTMSLPCHSFTLWLSPRFTLPMTWDSFTPSIPSSFMLLYSSDASHHHHLMAARNHYHHLEASKHFLLRTSSTCHQHPRVRHQHTCYQCRCTSIVHLTTSCS